MFLCILGILEVLTWGIFAAVGILLPRLIIQLAGVSLLFGFILLPVVMFLDMKKKEE